MKTINLRSDTVTAPTDAMRRAMAAAEIGDDGYGLDPTVNRLEALAAELFHQEAGLFVPSGTMGNLLSQLAQARNGDALILARNAHIGLFEGGNSSTIAGLASIVVDAPGGIRTPQQVVEALDHSQLRKAARLLAIENTHNAAGGTCLSPAETQALGAFAASRGLAMHIDGARIFNTAVALDLPPHALMGGASTLTFCLSKGLGCPAGSLIVGSRDVIDACRTWRRALGGGMRQSGVLAAAGLYALEHMVERLAEDHGNARLLAQGLTGLGMQVTNPRVETNIIFARTPDGCPAGDLHRAFREQGILVNDPRNETFRFLTHHDVTRADILEAIGRIGAAIEAMRMPATGTFGEAR